MKIIAFYLPQFHEIPENNKWYGKGFTEWTNTRKAAPLFNGYYQPRTPYEYYNLLDKSTFKNQIDLAHKFGIYGFCFYHYWFKDGKKLLEKPVENFLNNKAYNQKFCLCWANESWSRRWDGSDNDVLMPQYYGNVDDWKKHFYYLLNFFKDDKYIKYNDKPMLLIYKPDIIPQCNDMLDLWNALAIKEGLNGLCFVSQFPTFNLDKTADDSKFDLKIMFEPLYEILSINLKSSFKDLFNEVKEDPKFFYHVLYSRLRKKLLNLLNKNSFDKFNYDIFYEHILKKEPLNNKYVPGAFVGWDNSPRRQKDATIFFNSTPEKFEKYLTKQIEKTKKTFNKDILFITAWNEWAEGSYLEPDKKYGTKYLEAVKSALIKNKEFPFVQ